MTARKSSFLLDGQLQAGAHHCSALRSAHHLLQVTIAQPLHKLGDVTVGQIAVAEPPACTRAPRVQPAPLRGDHSSVRVSARNLVRAQASQSALHRPEGGLAGAGAIFACGVHAAHRSEGNCVEGAARDLHNTRKPSQVSCETASML
jgi:hypothetical protein